MRRSRCRFERPRFRLQPEPVGTKNAIPPTAQAITMKFSLRPGALVAALMLCVMATTPARGDGAGLYFSLSAGGQILAEDTLSGTGGVIEPQYTFGLVGGGAIGYELPILPIRFEAEAMYRTADFNDVTAITGTPITTGTEFPANGAGKVLSGMLNAYVFLPIPIGLEPYAGIGVGYARVTIDGLAAGGSTLVSGSDEGLAVQGIVGVEFDFFPGPIDLGLEYRYFAMQEVTIAGTGGSFGLNYASHAVLLRLRLSL